MLSVERYVEARPIGYSKTYLIFLYRINTN